MPKISVIVPVYNVEPYLRRCVDSILAQTFTDFELILVDDGSPDGCPAICDEYAKMDDRVRVIHKANGGVSSARNCGLDEAIGELITFVDSDDYLKKDFLHDTIDDEYDYVISGHLHINVHSLEAKEMYFGNSSTNEITGKLLEELFEHFGDYWIMLCWGRVFKKSIIESNHIRFDKSLCIGEDYIFSVNYLVRCNSLAFCSSTNYVHNDYGEGTLSKTFSSKFFQDYAKAPTYASKKLTEKYGEIAFYQNIDEKIAKVLISCLGTVLTSTKYVNREKVKILRQLFSNQYFRMTIKNANYFYKDCSVYYRILIMTRMPWLVVMCFNLKKKERKNESSN